MASNEIYIRVSKWEKRVRDIYFLIVFIDNVDCYNLIKKGISGSPVVESQQLYSFLVSYNIKNIKQWFVDRHPGTGLGNLPHRRYVGSSMANDRDLFSFHLYSSKFTLMFYISIFPLSLFFIRCTTFLSPQPKTRA